VAAKSKKGGAKRTPPKKSASSARGGKGGRPPSGARMQQAQRERERRAVRNRLVIAGAALVVAVGVIFFASRDTGPSVPDQLETGVGGCRYDTEFDGTNRDQGDHVPNPTYELDPPAGGPHLAAPADPGFYEGERVLPDGRYVHAMEHGFVVLWFKPGLPEEKVAQIDELSDQFGRELIVAERESLAGEVAVTAWHKRLLCDELVPEKVALFTRSFKDQGPEKGFL
jgi:hypothetical protein